MANVTVTFDITDAEANALPLRSIDDGEGNRTFETVNDYCKRLATADAAIRVEKDRQRAWDSLTNVEKDKAVVDAKTAR